ncbi:MAG: hypothetical protein HYV09_40935 [Deltaproteobacteria bacterium]|nr:hypothetical protein [Deltaproteobacteria bacterium]
MSAVAVRSLALAACLATCTASSVGGAREVRAGGRAWAGLSTIDSFSAVFALALGATVDAHVSSRVAVGGFLDVPVRTAVPRGESCYYDALACEVGFARTGARARFDALPPSHSVALWAAPAAGVQVFWRERETSSSDGRTARELELTPRFFVEQSAGIDVRSGRVTFGPYAFVGYGFGSGPLGGFGLHVTALL